MVGATVLRDVLRVASRFRAFGVEGAVTCVPAPLAPYMNPVLFITARSRFLTRASDRVRRLTAVRLGPVASAGPPFVFGFRFNSSLTLPSIVGVVGVWIIFWARA